MSNRSPSLSNRFVRLLSAMATAGAAGVATVPLVAASPQVGVPVAIDASGPAVVAGISLLVLAAFVLLILMRRLRRQMGEERQQRQALERRLQAATRLEQLGVALSSARMPADVARVSTAAFMDAAQATAGAVGFVSAEGTHLEVAHSRGHQDPIEGSFALSPMGAIALSLQRRDLVGTMEGLPEVAFEVDGLLSGRPAFVVVPLIASAGALGVAMLGCDRPQAFESDEREWLLEAGRRTAQALERARLYESAELAREEGEAFRVRAAAELQERRRAEEAHRESEARYRALAARTHRLYNLNAALSEAITLQAVARAVVRQGRSVVGAAAGSVALCVESDAFETLYAEEYPPAVVEAWQRFPVEPGLCTTAAVTTRSAVLVGSFDEWQAQYPRSAATAADGGFASAASLPLLVDNVAIGVLSFHFTVPVNFDQEYQALLTSVAHHAAQAIDRARLYETTQQACIDAEAANRAKDDFLSIVSHELRTPLNAILGWATMLRDGSLHASRLDRAVDSIVNNATRQARLIDDLLEVSRIVAGRVSVDLQELELADIVRGAVEAMLPAAAQRGLDLQVERLPQARVVADPQRLEQVFGNLVANALKFTPAGGRVTIEGEADCGMVRIRVIDTGSGIDADVLPYIFERFRQGNHTTARSVGGLGLGLFIVRRLVEAFGGQVSAESAGRNAGATFTVILPLVAPSAVEHVPPRLARMPEVARGSVLPDLSGIRVLVVDDEPDAREMACSALELRGAIVRMAGSVREALAALGLGRVDVLLADLAMPDEDGYALIRQIREHPDPGVAHLPSAAVTACAREDERRRALDAGFHLHLAKPIAPATLVETVARLAGTAAANV